jgi:hypothetical protein
VSAVTPVLRPWHGAHQRFPAGVDANTIRDLGNRSELVSWSRREMPMAAETSTPQTRMWRMVAYGMVLVISLAVIVVLVAG